MSEFNPFGARREAASAARAPSRRATQPQTSLLVAALAAPSCSAPAAYLLLGGGGARTASTAFVPSARAPAAAAPRQRRQPPVTLPVASEGRPRPRTLPRALRRSRAAWPDADRRQRRPPDAAHGPAPARPRRPSSSSTAARPPTPPAPVAAHRSSPRRRRRPAPAAQSTVALKDVAAGKDGTNPTGTFVYDGKTGHRRAAATSWPASCWSSRCSRTPPAAGSPTCSSATARRSRCTSARRWSCSSDEHHDAAPAPSRGRVVLSGTLGPCFAG